jgi:putative pyruvate formate lyase activating enzyme
MHCIFCQNHEISAGRGGQIISIERLAEIFLELEAQGAANINLVTAAQYVPQTVRALLYAKDQGLHIPVVYNSGGYESVETLKRLEGLVDIYLPDFKYMEVELAEKFSHAPDYPQIAKAAIHEMVRQSGPCVYGEDGYLKRGTIVRHLLMPGHTRNSKAVLAYLHETYGDGISVSIMNQYTPVQEQPEYPELNRKVTRREYEKVLDYAMDLGITNGFFQEGGTAAESFIPQFDCEGVASKTP